MNKDENLAKAEDFKKSAERMYKDSISEQHPFSRFCRLDESTKLMKNAANHFRLAKDWRNAANAFLKAAQIKKENGCNFSSLYEEAAKMQMKYDKTAALQTLVLQAHSHCAQGEMSSAASVKEKIGEIYEAEKQHLLAAKSYSEAFELREMNALIVPLSTFDLLLKAAELKVLVEANKQHIQEAIQVYENVRVPRI